jgi:hypothetical protein
MILVINVISLRALRCSLRYVSERALLSRNNRESVRSHGVRMNLNKGMRMLQTRMTQRFDFRATKKDTKSNTAIGNALRNPSDGQPLPTSFPSTPLL